MRTPLDHQKASIASLLNDNHILIAEILSYVVTSTLDLAKLRQVSKRWISDVLPYYLSNHAFCLKTCFPGAKVDFISELIKLAEGSYGGKRYDEIDVYSELFAEHDKFDFFVDESVSVQSMLIVSDKVKKDFKIIQKDYRSRLDYNDDRFSEFCHSLWKSTCWKQFLAIGKEALSQGMFLSMEDMKNASEMPDFAYETRVIPIILTVRLNRNDLTNVITYSPSGRQKVYLKVKIPASENNKSQSMVPFVKFLTSESKDGGFNSLSTFAGYNVTSDKTSDEDERTFTCQVPLTVAWWELIQMLEDYGLAEEQASSFIPLDWLWKMCQEQAVREGVAIADGVIPTELQKRLMQQIDDFASDQPFIDYHPHSDNQVRNVVHPALYPYVKGVSPLSFPNDEIPPAAYSQETNVPTLLLQNSNYWGRRYEASSQYQWLPTYFDINQDGDCEIYDYINNLVPREKYEDLYTSLAQLFSHALPFLESVFAYCQVVKQHHLRNIDTNYTWNPIPPGRIQERRLSLRGQKLQIVTKIVDCELEPGETYEGVWHVEGMPHEEIVATAIYFIDRDDDIHGGNILFKRAFHRQEADCIFSTISQSCPREVETMIAEGLLPVGQIETNKGRLVVFPNSHVHKVTELKNLSRDIKQKRRIIVFFLINPGKRILSTREVPTQQEHVGGSMKKSSALVHRLKVMIERKYMKQDWNVRNIELCED
jgi:hypothetical protein